MTYNQVRKRQERQLTKKQEAALKKKEATEAAAEAATEKLKKAFEIAQAADQSLYCNSCVSDSGNLNELCRLGACTYIFRLVQLLNI